MQDMIEVKENIIIRSPVVVVMGHVDHGKSSLLEAIRKDFVITAKESGGITQHIGAYEIKWQEKPLTFIDTPGHEAFSAIRQRGAGVADIALLVIDGGEGMKQQTKEALNFIKKAGIPMIVVFNKMDKPGFDPEKVKQELAKEDILTESWGGKVLSSNVSAKTGQGIPELLETILLLAEMEDLQTDLSLPLEATVIESSLAAQKGPMATLLLIQGVLQPGDIVATQFTWGKIKCLHNFEGKLIDQALPGQPVVALGFEDPPVVGEIAKIFDSKEKAQEYVKDHRAKRKPMQVVGVAIGPEGSKKVLNVILKNDVLSSGQAIEGILVNLPQDQVDVRILRSEAGNINLADVRLAENGKAVIFGFRVKVEDQANEFALQKKVRIKNFDIIYELVQEVRNVMTNVLSPTVKRSDLGKFKITVIFKQSKDMQIVGGKVLDGEILRELRADVQREEEIIGHGRIKGLQQDKKDIGKVTKGKEAGVSFSGDVKLQEEDVLLLYKEEKEKGVL